MRAVFLIEERNTESSRRREGSGKEVDKGESGRKVHRTIKT
jgi:hypothetical protein